MNIDIKDDFSDNASIILHTGDAFCFLKSIPDNTVRLVVTSPPYNLGKEYETKVEIEKYY